MRVKASSDIILLSFVQEAINQFAHSREDDERNIVTRRSVYVGETGEPGEAQTFSLKVDEKTFRTIAVALAVDSQRTEEGGHEVIPVIIQFYEGDKYPKSVTEWQRNILVPATITGEEAFEKYAGIIGSVVFTFLVDGKSPPASHAH